MPTVKSFLILLFLPILGIFWLGGVVYWKLGGKKQSKKTQQSKELRKKGLEHLRNFSPSRLKNKCWSKGFRKKKRKKAVKNVKKS